MNGFTRAEDTTYVETVPAEKLPTILWLEADRMRSLAVTPDNLKNQQEVVKEEKRLSFDNRAYSNAIAVRLPELAYSNYANQHSTIGSMADLDAAEPERCAVVLQDLLRAQQCDPGSGRRFRSQTGPGVGDTRLQRHPEAADASETRPDRTGADGGKARDHDRSAGAAARPADGMARPLSQRSGHVCRGYSLCHSVSGRQFAGVSGDRQEAQTRARRFRAGCRASAGRA